MKFSLHMHTPEDCLMGLKACLGIKNIRNNPDI